MFLQGQRSPCDPPEVQYGHLERQRNHKVLEHIFEGTLKRFDLLPNNMDHLWLDIRNMLILKIQVAMDVDPNVPKKKIDLIFLSNFNYT